MLKVTKGFNIYRVIMAIGFLLAIALSLAIPAHMNEPDDWAYYYAVKNFSQGKLAIDDALHLQQVNQARQQGGLMHLRASGNAGILKGERNTSKET